MRAVVRSAWSRFVCNLNWPMQAAAIQGAMLQRLAVVPLHVNLYLTLALPPVFSARGSFLREALGGRTRGSSEAPNTSAVSVRCDLVGAALALSVAFLVIRLGNLPS